jgi:hypothetical protein
MNLHDAKICGTFTDGGRRWLITDVGTRTVVAVCISPASRKNDWLRSFDEDDDVKEVVINLLEAGRPVCLEEHVFDARQLVGCSREA